MWTDFNNSGIVAFRNKPQKQLLCYLSPCHITLRNVDVQLYSKVNLKVMQNRSLTLNSLLP